MAEAARISSAQKAGRAGYDLEDVKVTFTADISTSVSGTDVSGREGDVLNLPRWVARALEEGGHARVDEPSMEPELKQAISKENGLDDYQLASLDDHFYVRVQAHLERAPQQKREELGSMLNSLVRSRVSKIARLVISSKLSATNAEKLTIEERSLYEQMRASHDEFVAHATGGAA
ncbi:MAG: DNA replication complex GINS family protein [Thaumarchaeota archaeon]|nr:DNA replication complex GINS family protein [Nitrososphaerota archaeon]RNJ71513.1 MAG: DNA replication complex GINS family protein [Thaumarchaeota archaeon S14]RNJ72423.1 MAG: DNA replication complex GINS family protein [Thaumarchaeota archaeon S13]RNJ76701.1 MAG: DNA replication complex GINS family protein [Thaumarchaeota archaeon S15]MDD9813596.1 DNA replication complex GINS family protein [Nitrososphaerota archaeon]